MNRVVSAAPEDRPDIVALLRSCALPTEDLPPTLDHFFVAGDDDLDGVIGLEVFGSRGLVRSLAVAPGRRGQGLAHELWQHALARARALGVRELYLLTTTAEAIFAHWGFTPVARDDAPEEIRRTEEFRNLCPSSAAVMRLVMNEFLRPSSRPSV